MTIRGDILSKAKELTEGERNAVHGDPHQNMVCFTSLVTAYLNGKLVNQDQQLVLTEVDGPIIQALFKISRIAANQKHDDNYTDLAAYAAIAGECAGVSV